MQEHELIIKVKTNTVEEAKELLNIFQGLVNDFGTNKLLSLVDKVKGSPDMVKKAIGFLNFI